MLTEGLRNPLLNEKLNGNKEKINVMLTSKLRNRNDNKVNRNDNKVKLLEKQKNKHV